VNTAVGIKISVLQGSESGTAVYEETQTATTNVNGLLSIQIGTGTATNGTFAGIDWANGPYFIKTETDPTGGNNYSIVGTQQLLWSVQPDLIIETGIARGGSLIFYASILELIAQCGGPANAKVLGIDIDIRSHNKDAILAHPMSKRIEMIQGSSIDKAIADQVKQRARSAKKVLVCLDSNHTHEHVLNELRLYAPLVSLNSYVIVFDTAVEDLPSNLIKDRPWARGNNPKTAVIQYLKEIQNKEQAAEDGLMLNLEFDRDIENQLLITVAPSGFLRRY
jgi:cephalosporin hydroxylase